MKSIQKPAIYQLVVDRLRREIHLGTYLPGERLPAERDIARHFSVSRDSVREAIRILAEEGYLISRRGANGGLVVTSLMKPIARMRERIQSDLEGFRRLIEFRLANETAAARLAAERRAAHDLTRIKRAIDDLFISDTVVRFRKADSDFHLAVAAASRNPFIEEAVEGVRHAIFLLHADHPYDILLDTTVDGHRQVYEAIRASDPNEAARAMADHIEVGRKEMLATLGHVESARA